jgi:hypothetical protein
MVPTYPMLLTLTLYGDVNINRFIYLVLLFFMLIIFLIISPNIISILLG